MSCSAGTVVPARAQGGGVLRARLAGVGEGLVVVVAVAARAAGLLPGPGPPPHMETTCDTLLRHGTPFGSEDPPPRVGRCRNEERTRTCGDTP
jgi:hypothetical protein